MDLFVSGVSDVGIKRSVNQDSILVRKINSSSGSMAFACICDGMGGLSHGELASATVLYAFKSWTENELPCLTGTHLSERIIFNQWETLIDECNSKIMAYGQNSDIVLGTTITALLITETDYYIANIGDSRAYIITDTARQLTKDHTFVQQEIDCGRMTPEEAEASKKSHILTRCVGAKPGVSPDFYHGEIQHDAIYMLCSDGFRHRISVEEMAGYLSPRAIDSTEALKAAQEQLVELNMERRESDNISVVSVLVK